MAQHIRISMGLRTALALAALTVAVPSLPAQDALYTTRAQAAWDGFGARLEVLGDVDGDDIGDMAVSCVGSGLVRVLSGADGHELYALRGGAGFGLTLAHGDFDGDGLTDLAVGAPLQRDASDGHEAGAVYQYAGHNGALIHAQFGGPGDQQLGHTLIPLGDLDGGGAVDLLIGGIGSGIRILRNEDHSNQFSHAAEDHGSWAGPLGSAGIAVVLGDLDGDGLSDWVLAPSPSGAESDGVRLLLSGDPSARRTLSSGASDDGFGWSVAGVDDVDGDGVSDIVVGAPGDDTLARDGGAVHVFSGRTCEQLFVIHGATADGRLGGAVGGMSDLDEDGVPDICATAQDGPFGVLRTFSSGHCAPDMASADPGVGGDRSGSL